MPHKDSKERAAYMKQYQQNNRERWRAYARAYYVANKDKWNTENVRIRRREWARRQRSKRKKELIAAYGGKCVCCGESRIEFLSVDHVFGDGCKERKTLKSPSHGTNLHQHLKNQGWPKDRYRLLCFNCNLARGFFGYCPHEKESVQCAAAD